MENKILSNLLRVPGAVLVAGAAVLWGLDGLFRRPLAQNLHASTIVFLEHLIALLVLLPLLPRSIRAARKLDWRGWLAIIFVGAGASAVATILFTQAFGTGDAITPLVLQKLQPLIAVLGAYILLKERLHERYWLFFVCAVGAAWLLIFPHPFDIHVKDAKVSLLAISAAMLWGMGTVFGRQLSYKLQFEEITTLRYAIGLPTSLFLLRITHSPATVPADDYLPLAVMALISGGLFALMLYYLGMQRTPASVATLAELAFPLTASVVGVWFLDSHLAGSQWIGAALLCATVTALGLQSAKGKRSVGVDDKQLSVTERELVTV